MKSYAFTNRVPEGKTEALRQFGKELSGPRHAELEDSMRRLGLTKECRWIQSAPEGQLFLTYFEGTADIVEANSRFANSTDPFDVWFQRRIAELLDTDLNIPLSEDAVELLYEVRDEAASQRARAQAVAGRVRPEATGMAREFAAELAGPRHADAEEFRRRYGITAESLFLQRRGRDEFLIQYAEAADPERFYYEWPRSEHPFDLWRQQMLREITGVEYTEIVGPLPELVFEAQVAAGVFAR